MEKFEEELKKLIAAVKAGPEYLEKSSTIGLAYVTAIVCPPLREALNDLCLPIEDLHKVEETESAENNVVIHYTSMDTLVSMLQDASKESEDLERKDKEHEREGKEPELDSTKGGKKALWRLYDSVHLNDPDEGNNFARNLNIPKKYDWLKKEDLSHAYIASFVLPKGDSQEDLSNNLVFWQAYGQEGEGCSLALPVPRNLLRKVRYGTDDLKPTRKILMPGLNALLGSLEPLVKFHQRPLRNDVRELLARAVWEYLERFRYLYKSDAYKHEKECRLVVAESDIQNKDKIFFEDKNLNNSPIRIKHYYEHEDLKIRTLLATGSSITLGPRVLHADNVCYFLNTLRQRAGLAYQKIKISKIPYRKV